MAQSGYSKNDRFEGYVPVAERIDRFYERFPEGRIVTSIVEHDAESGFILMRAEVFRAPDDANPAATGHAFEVRSESYVNKTSYIENCESSAVGRALALLGFEVRRGVASREEMEKAARMQGGGGGEAAARGAEDRGPRRQPQQQAPAQAQRAASNQPPVSAADADGGGDATLDAEIVDSAGALGYDATKVRKWVNQKFGVTGGLDSLTTEDKREVLKVFREKAQSAQGRR